MSGRDVRRLAARAANMTHEAKRDIVARVVAGADAVGIADIYVAREPFSIAQGALEHMPLDANLHIVDIPITHTAKDTAAAMHLFKEAGCHTVVSLGGDGTNRALVQADSAIDLVPISTGTNNVFPALMEPTLGGMVAGLNALGKTIGMPESLRPRAKVLHLKTHPHRHRTYRCGVVAARSCRQHAAFRLGPPRSHVTYSGRAEFRWYVADRRLYRPCLCAR